jgi:prolyl-tRNA editing enzyme YbaK/EbsC (Cys-tRNA(Pro) deacylase)
MRWRCMAHGSWLMARVHTRRVRVTGNGPVTLAAMSPSERVLAHLDSLGADYEVIDIDPDLADTAAFCAAYGFTLDESANAILVASRRPEGHHAVCVVLATTRLDVNHRVRTLLRVQKVSFADAETTRQLTGMEIGGVTPFGLPNGVRVMVDSGVVATARCIVGGGSRSIKIRLDPEVFGRMEGVEIVDALARHPA